MKQFALNVHDSDDASVASPTSQSVESSVVDLTARLDSLVQAYSSSNESSLAYSAPSTPSARGGTRRSSIVVIADAGSASSNVVRQLKSAASARTHLATTESQALAKLIQIEPDVVLLAMHLEGKPTASLLQFVRSKPKLAESFVIALVRHAKESDFKERALKLGVNDFLSLPAESCELIPRVSNGLALRSYQEFVATEKSRLEQLVRRRTQELEQSRQQLILSLARAAEHRDEDTGNHVVRVGRYAGIIARQLGWPDDRIELLEQAAQLHDVGKIGVPDSILFKPGKLDPREFDIIKQHCGWGKSIIQPFSNDELNLIKAHARVGESILHVRTSPMLMMASRIAQTHHENWDGSGYPLGLAGEDIPIEGRITAIADVFDALSSKRPYKDPFPRDVCFRLLVEQSGVKFDPQLVDAFLARAEDVVKCQMELMDEVAIHAHQNR